MRYLLLAMLMVGQFASAAVSKKYKIYFQGDYGYSAQSAKQDFLEEMPGTIAQYLPEVEWKVLRQGKSWIVVKVDAPNKNRIDGFLYTIRASTQDAIAGIEEVR